MLTTKVSVPAKVAGGFAMPLSGGFGMRMCGGIHADTQLATSLVLIRTSPNHDRLPDGHKETV